jgi:hypothetical protein
MIPAYVIEQRHESRIQRFGTAAQLPTASMSATIDVQNLTRHLIRV